MKRMSNLECSRRNVPLRCSCHRAPTKCESFMKTLKQEEIRANEYRDLEHLRKNVTEFVEHYYNGQRLHSALGYQTPEAFERNVTPGTANRTESVSFLRHEEIY